MLYVVKGRLNRNETDEKLYGVFQSSEEARRWATPLLLEGFVILPVVRV